jgi:hypothetical protein
MEGNNGASRQEPRPYQTGGSYLDSFASKFGVEWFKPTPPEPPVPRPNPSVPTIHPPPQSPHLLNVQTSIREMAQNLRNLPPSSAISPSLLNRSPKMMNSPVPHSSVTSRHTSAPPSPPSDIPPIDLLDASPPHTPPRTPAASPHHNSPSPGLSDIVHEDVLRRRRQ